MVDNLQKRYPVSEILGFLQPWFPVITEIFWDWEVDDSEEGLEKMAKLTGFRVKLTPLGSHSGSAASDWLCVYEQVTSPARDFFVEVGR